MTSKPASVFKLEDRGILKQGKKADIVILNEKTVIDKSTFIDPIQYPEGIYTVIVNGEIILDNKVRSKRLTGEVIRIS